MPSVATTQVERFSIDHERKTLTSKRIERSSSRALRYEREEAEQVYESHYSSERGPASGPRANQRRRAQQQAATTPRPASAAHGNPNQMNGWSDSSRASPQRVRLIETNGAQLGPSSQRASRSSLSNGLSNGTRMGRFVNYYPASRQPSPSGRHQPNPYAFHVPTSYTLPAPGATRRDLHHYSSQYELIGAAQQAQADSQLSSELPAAPPRQSSYGFVAPLDRVEGALGSRQFNKSLRSRTISHLPSMVQVSILEEDKCREFSQQQQQRKPAGDLLKAHVVAWRSDAQLEQDNPFRPGTELSWEAELMVRLIKRGYPIDQLPSLVEAAKLEAAARPSGRRPDSKAIPNSKSMSQLSQLTAASKSKSNSIDSRAIWADSLKRAKSVPRLEANSKQDSDSIDRLITSIEMDVIERDHGRSSGAESHAHESPVASIQSEKNINRGALAGKFQPPLASSPTRTKKTKTSPTKERKQQAVRQEAPAKPIRAKQQQAGQLMASSDRKTTQTEAKQMAVAKQKKRRCCTIH